MTSSVTAVYLHVVDSVIGKLREELLNEGADDAVLTELQAIWEVKMLQCGAIEGPLERSAIQKTGVPTPVHDLNVPYEAPEEYETPTAEMLFPPTPLQTPMQTPLPVDTPGYQYFSPGPNEYASTPTPDGGGGFAADAKNGRPPHTQRPSPWMNQRPLGVDVNIAYEEAREDVIGGSDIADGSGDVLTTAQQSTQEFLNASSGKRKRDEHASYFVPGGYIPQQDGSGDAHENEPLCDELQQGVDADIVMTRNRINQSSLKIPQNDGFPDNYDEGVGDEVYRPSSPAYTSGTPSFSPAPGYYASTPYNVGTPTPNTVGTPKPPKSEAADDDEPPLNEDDDDDDDLDELEGDDVPTTNHLVLAQFEKVNRTKSRWKCILKDGIMHLNNKDILFSKANGEFEF